MKTSVLLESPASLQRSGLLGIASRLAVMLDTVLNQATVRHDSTLVTMFESQPSSRHTGIPLVVQVVLKDVLGNSIANTSITLYIDSTRGLATAATYDQFFTAGPDAVMFWLCQQVVRVFGNLPSH